MKRRPVFILVFIGILFAVFYHRTKCSTERNGINELSDGLHNIETSLPEGANFSFRMLNVNPDLYLWSRYLLAPRYLSVSEEEQFDTILSICRLDASDSLLKTITANKVIIWKNSDREYKYILTKSSD